MMADAIYRALLIGNATFPKDAHNLPELKGPPNDIKKLKEALTDPLTGLFHEPNVISLLNKSRTDVMSAIEDFFDAASTRDQLLLYYSGHGRLNAANDLFLCTLDTETPRLRATAVAARHISEAIDFSRARTKVILLDCCHSGTFKGGNLPSKLSGKGRFVITSSMNQQLAEDAKQASSVSPFTSHLVDALLQRTVELRDGSLDADQDGYLSVEDVYGYIESHLQEQLGMTPQRDYSRAIGDAALARRIHLPARLGVPTIEADDKLVGDVRPSEDSGSPSESQESEVDTQTRLNLRIAYSPDTVEVSLEHGETRLSSRRPFLFHLASEDHERIRWYLEDYVQYPIDPAPRIAAEVESRMVQIGRELFEAVFGTSSNYDASLIWKRVRSVLADTRIEISSSSEDEAGIPWEFMQDPSTGLRPALQAHSFVRNVPDAFIIPPRINHANVLRILLIVCRPQGRKDVPFRSVATHLTRLGFQEPDKVEVDLLRPPTFAGLASTLRSARRDGRPYDLVHFDGHGVYFDAGKLAGSDPTASFLSPIEPGKRGYLIFEDPDDPRNNQLVDGAAFGSLLMGTGSHMIVLNACSTAQVSDIPRSYQTSSADEREDGSSLTTVGSVIRDYRAPVRAYGSFAHEVMRIGVPAIVAMRYSIYAVTAAQFVGALYGALLDGTELGEAVNAGRNNLFEQPYRNVARHRMRVQDWVVPVLYEQAPMRFLSKPLLRKRTVSAERARAVRQRLAISASLPGEPDVGFWGRDDAILEIDRAFDRNSVVMLWGPRGSGTSATVVEFARWYALTGGIRGRVVVTSFDECRSLDDALDQLAAELPEEVVASGFHWSRLDTGERRGAALTILHQVAVLWIWDELQSHTTLSLERRDLVRTELVNFLRQARHTKARILLASDCDEHDWLSELPVRIKLAPMPLWEQLELAGAVAARYRHNIMDPEIWVPLLRLSEGSPGRVVSLVSHVVRNGLTRKEQINEFVAFLQGGGDY